MKTAYIIVSNLRVQQVEVLRTDGDFCLITFNGKRLQLRKSRLYASEEEAYGHMPRPERLPAPDVGIESKRSPAPDVGIESKRSPSFYERGT